MDFMALAIEIAKTVDIDVPVGAVLVKNGEIISKATNKKELSNDITSHAEINVIKEAATKLNNWRLNDCELYVTLEPCPMCAWAILQSRIKAVYFGSFDTKYGAFGSVLDLRKNISSNLKVFGGLKEDECDKILEEFWKKQRNDD